jgi:acetylornithine deacetylase
VEINSVNPSLDPNAEGEANIADFLRPYLEKMGMTVYFQAISLGRKNIIGILKGTGGGKSLMLNGHIDTVSIENMEHPLTPTIVDGNLYGRGSYDMKGGLVSCIMAIDSIVNSGIKLKGNLILALVADEEYISLGTEELVKEFTADSAIICEPTNMEIVIAHKGFLWSEIEIFGRAAHGSRPEEGIDAIMKAGKVLIELEKLQKEKYPNIKHMLLGSPSIHASLIEGGLGLSTYPDYCKISIERRTLPDESQEDVVDELVKLLIKIEETDEEFRYKLNSVFYRPGLEVSQNEEIVQMVAKAKHKLYLEESKFSGESYWMDSALLAEAGIPTVIIGPTGEGAHSAVEYVEIESVIKVAEILREVVINYCEMDS